jgi:hypothetical protein
MLVTLVFNVIKVLQDHPDGLTFDEISRYFQGRFPDSDITRCLCNKNGMLTGILQSHDYFIEKRNDERYFFVDKGDNQPCDIVDKMVKCYLEETDII